MLSLGSDAKDANTDLIDSESFRIVFDLFDRDKSGFIDN